MKNTRGFTLIEILIALAVFAIIATISSSAMFYAFNTRERVTEQANRLADLELAISLLQRDIVQIINRPAYSKDMQRNPAFIGQPHELLFTRDGMTNPNLEEKRSSLKRIGYVCQKNQLIRKSHANLDSAKVDEVQKVLLSNIKKCQFSYLNYNLERLNEWRENAVQQNQKKEPLPKAIQLTITLKDWGDASFLFILPKALYD